MTRGRGSEARRDLMGTTDVHVRLVSDPSLRSQTCLPPFYDENAKTIYHRILHDRLQFPSYMSGVGVFCGFGLIRDKASGRCMFCFVFFSSLSLVSSISMHSRSLCSPTWFQHTLARFYSQTQPEGSSSALSTMILHEGLATRAAR